MTSRRVIAAGIALLAFASCTSKPPKATPSSTAPTAASSSSGSQLMQSVVVAIRQAGSFHLRATSTHNGQTAVFVQDIGRTQGRQSITIGRQRVTILVINSVAYQRANGLALRQFMGFPADVASRLQDRWVSFVPTDGPYTDIAASVTLDSALNEIALDGAITVSKPTTILGRSVVGLSGTSRMNGTETLYVPTSGPPLPVQEVLTQNGDTETITFSGWGERVVVTKPTGVIAFSSVVTSSGGGQTV